MIAGASLTWPRSSGDARLQLDGDRMRGPGAADDDRVDRAVAKSCSPPPKALKLWNLK